MRQTTASDPMRTLARSGHLSYFWPMPNLIRSLATCHAVAFVTFGLPLEPNAALSADAVPASGDAPRAVRSHP